MIQYIKFVLGLLVLCVAATAQANNEAATKLEPVLVFVHGRDQPAGQSDVVRGEWFSAIDKGLQRTGREGLFPASQRRFYWYADLLNREDACKLAFGTDSLRALGWRLWPTARDFFLASASQLPDGAKQAIVDQFLPDTGKYLENGKVACAVDDGLEALWRGVPEGAPVVVVAHSMGSIVLYKNLTGQLRNTPHRVYLITIGSMIAQPDVQASILGSLQKPPAPVPGPVVWWRNIVNRGDLLAFRAASAFMTSAPAKLPIDIEINTDVSDRHSAAAYLESEAMGKAVREAYCQAMGAKAGCAPK